MLDEKEFKKILLNGTRLIQRLIRNEITLENFIKNYNNFYYYNALDGHEADKHDKKLFGKFSDLLQLHKEIQTNLIDRLYFGDETNSSQYLTAGRILPKHAGEIIKNIVNNYDVDGLIKSLSEKK